jgi:predicted HTH transcriptional regulator
MRHNKLKVFVSSVQKELESERVAISSLITTDPFLMQHCEPVLFEYEPAPFRKLSKPYLKCLDGCQIYLLLIYKDYGNRDGKLSATHHEYRHAQKLDVPTIIFVKGTSAVDGERSLETKAFFDEIRKNKHTYKRFIDRLDLREEVRAALTRTLTEEFHIEPTIDEAQGGKELIEAASAFESAPLAGVPWKSLDESLLGQFSEKVVGSSGVRVSDESVCQALHARGLLWRKDERHQHCATAAGLLLFGRRPGDQFPQCEILIDAYADTRISGKPRGQLTVNAGILGAIDQVLAFIDKHTFHPTRVVGINNITLDEYPEPALREALINAVAHRNYEDASRKIIVQVFSDRIVISSPGYPPSPLTLAKLKRGNYRPCSRNPVIAQALAALTLMEQRGSGFARMRDAMLNHGLDAPTYAQQDGYFVGSFSGPNGNYHRLRVPEGAKGMIPPAIEAQLNKRQKRILLQVQKVGTITSGWCRTAFAVTYDTANRDLIELVEKGLLTRVGKGRSTKFELRKP